MQGLKDERDCSCNRKCPSKPDWTYKTLTVFLIDLSPLINVRYRPHSLSLHQESLATIFLRHLMRAELGFQHSRTERQASFLCWVAIQLLGVEVTVAIMVVSVEQTEHLSQAQFEQHWSQLSCQARRYPSSLSSSLLSFHWMFSFPLFVRLEGLNRRFQTIVTTFQI